MVCLALPNSRASAANCTDRQEVSRLAGSMIIAGFFGTRVSDTGFQRTLADLEEGLIGGVLVLGRNVGERTDLEEMVRRFSTCKCSTPPFIAIDEEGGSIERLGANLGLEETPSATAVAQGSVAAAHKTYGALARKLASFRFNTNLGPVVDLNRNPQNPIIGRLHRSYGDETGIVVKYASIFIQEHHKKRIITVLKHFPGHGSSSADSHDRLADITTSWSTNELKPFKHLIRSGLADAIMVGHLANSTKWGGAATQSGSNAISRMLREELQYQGVVITDDLAMRAISDERKTVPDAAVDAILAGADVVLVGRMNDEDQASDVGREVNRTLTARACTNEISIEDLEKSSRRIQRLKSRWR